MWRRSTKPDPWDETCPGFRRSMVEAIATGHLPDWVAGHMSACVACRRGLASVVARATPSLSKASRDLADHVAFVAKVRGLAREIADLGRSQGAAPRRKRPGIRSSSRSGTSAMGDLGSESWRLPAGVALVMAVATAGLAAWLIARGPDLSASSLASAPPHGVSIQPQDPSRSLKEADQNCLAK